MIGTRLKWIVLAACLLARILPAAEQTAEQIHALLDAGQVTEAAAALETTELSGAPVELIHARIALAREDVRSALRHLAKLQVVHYRDESVRPAALYYEALIDGRTGGTNKTVSALNELRALYPDSEWCRRAEKEFITTEIEKGASE